MADGLELLLIDDNPDPDRVLGEHLLMRCRRVAIARSLREGLDTLERSRATGGICQLLIANLARSAVDGLELLRELHRRQDAIPVVLEVDYAAADAVFESEARRLGAIAIIDRPADPGQVDEILASIRPAPERPRDWTGDYRAQPQSAQSGALEPVPLAPTRPLRMSPRPQPPPPPTGLVPRPGARPTGTPGGTSRTRRSVGPMTTPLPGLPGTSGLRPRTPARSLGALAPPPPPPAQPPLQAREVRCSACHGSVQVARKPTAYTTVCVHCGQLLRIDPL